MPWGVAAAAVGAVGSIASSSMGGSSPSQTSQTTNTPWSVQAPYLSSGFQSAQGIYNKQQNTPFYQGQLYAGLNPQQQSALTGLNGYAGGAGAGVANSQTGTGTSLLNGGSNFGANANSIYSMANGNPTSSITGNAAQYANNPYMKGMITAANQPIENQLNEQQVPGLNLAAAGSGNTDSSRAGVTEAIMRRDAGTQEANNAANIQGNAWNGGVNTAAGLYGTNMQGALGANGQMGTSAELGSGLLSQGYNTNLNNLNIPLQGGTLQQQDTQGQNNAAYQQWQGQQQFPWQQLQNYMGVVGGQQWGGTSTSTAQQNPSMLGSAIGGAGAGAGLYQLGNMFSSGNSGGGFTNYNNNSGLYRPSGYTGMP